MKLAKGELLQCDSRFCFLILGVERLVRGNVQNEESGGLGA